jgi:hypothetical protein
LVGWTRENYPAMKSGGAWALYEHGWRPLDPKTDQFHTGLSDEELKEAERMIELRRRQQPQPGPPPAAQQVRPKFVRALPATTRASTQPAAPSLPPTIVASTIPTTLSTTVASTQPLEPPILTDADGRKYFDGKQFLRIIDRDGKEIIWQLPPNAVGTGDVTLIRTEDGLLFLFNQPGRVIRIKPTPAGPEPFFVEAVFTEKIPTPEKIQRIWLDPAGRIVMAYDKHNLAIMFPQGRIPHDIAVLMLETKP